MFIKFIKANQKLVLTVLGVLLILASLTATDIDNQIVQTLIDSVKSL